MGHFVSQSRSEDNALGLNCAFYFLENRLKLGLDQPLSNQSIFEFAKTKINQIDKAKKQNDPYPLETSLTSLIKNVTFTNKNNYLELKPKSVIESTQLVNYPNSPFFSNQLQVLTENESTTLPTPKELIKCKDDKLGKKETGLRLFFKEGNDNILDKLIPVGGHGS